MVLKSNTKDKTNFSYYYIVEMKFIVKKDIYEGKILDVWQTRRECAKDIGVTEAAISQAVRLHGKCKNYYFERIEVPKENILKIIQ